jgi:uncharacterized protein YnzC (UPF0291/DUF896 family)
MGRRKKDEELTDEEIKEKRRQYMKKYYLKKKHSMVNGEFVKQEPKPPKVSPLTIKRGEFTVKFD